MMNRKGWQCDEANAKRGSEWQNRIYQHNQENIDNVLASQRDFGTSSFKSDSLWLTLFQTGPANRSHTVSTCQITVF